MRAGSNQQGQIVSRHDFLPFGEEVQPPTPPLADKRLFTGQERDAETGLDYFGARYYRPQVGRFTTIDPLQTTAENLIDPQKWNRYAYARNNPLRWVDPDGRDMRVATDALYKQLFRLADYAPSLAAEIIAAIKDHGIIVDIVEKNFKNTCTDNAPGVTR